ncbi:MAG: 1-(5-phosphoribosyl)-5-[(5-phosphoribosylamino)methylideneamino]imidazole-4-carboxamide isomerase [Sporolactobacillus sp.]
MFMLYPAIDLLNGCCVRLFQGDYAQSTVYDRSPIAVAQSFASQGAKWIHVVDLDGAKSGIPANQELICRMAEQTDCAIEVGGGIRTMETIDTYLSRGARRVILGSSAISDPSFTRAALRKYGSAIAIGLDVRDGKVAVEGWLERSETTPMQLAKELIAAGARHFIYTDISKDGAMGGTDRQGAVALAEAIGLPVVVSGGVHSLAELKRVIACGAQRISGAIIGKALYTGAVQLDEAEKLVIQDAR